MEKNGTFTNTEHQQLQNIKTKNMNKYVIHKCYT